MQYVLNTTFKNSRRENRRYDIFFLLILPQLNLYEKLL
jgi:hypothetical protein